MRMIYIIPARLEAQRLPGKPLEDIGGKTMIQRVWERVTASNTGRVVVAAGNPEIVQHVESWGGEAVLTDPQLPTGSDRVWQAWQRVDPERTYDYVCNVQGDMPFLEPQTLRVLTQARFEHPEFDIMTASALITDPREKETPSVVKLVQTPHDAPVGRALYFSRHCIPSGDRGPFYHHMGIYAYRPQALEDFVNAPQTLLEKSERLEQLRALEMGLSIGVCRVDQIPLSVDTPEDLAQARRMVD